MVRMSFSKSKIGKNPIFGQDKLGTDIGTDRTKHRVCPCPRSKTNAPKRCTWAGQTRDKLRLCPRTDNL